MQIEVEKLENTPVVSPWGQIDAYNVGQLKEQIQGMALPEGVSLIMDLSHVEHLDSAGISLLILTNRKLKKNGGELKLVRMPEGVRRLLDMAGLLPYLHLYDSPGHALAGLQTQPTTADL